MISYLGLDSSKYKIGLSQVSRVFTSKRNRSSNMVCLLYPSVLAHSMLAHSSKHVALNMLFGLPIILSPVTRPRIASHRWLDCKITHCKITAATVFPMDSSWCKRFTRGWAPIPRTPPQP